MARATRASAKASQDDVPPFSPAKSQTNGTTSRKRKASDSKEVTPQKTKRGRPAGKKGQLTLEETMPGAVENDDSDELGDEEMKDAADEVELGNDKVDDNDDKMVEDKANAVAEKKTNCHATEDCAGRKDNSSDGEKANGHAVGEEKTKTEVNTKENNINGEVAVDKKDNISESLDENATNNVCADRTTNECSNGIINGDSSKYDKEEQPIHGDKTETANTADAHSTLDHAGKVTKTDGAPEAAPNTNGHGAIQSSQSRGVAQPSNILEKGIIYFFIRPRVGTDQSEASGVQDVARSYIVLRPLPADAKLVDGPINDLGNNRLLALPKKVLPRTPADKFMTFVEKAGVKVEQLKDEFMTGGSYDNKTTGVRHTNPVTPVGEGIYAITNTGRESHLAYLLTIPEKMGNVQEDIGLAEKGAFVLSIKNPKKDGPPNATLPEGAKYSEEIMNEFRGLRWMPCQPKHLDYENAQLLLIGEAHGDLGKAVQAEKKDKEDPRTDTPAEEMEKLEDEDAHRVEGLKGDDTIFEDLGISSKDYPKVATTW